MSQDLRARVPALTLRASPPPGGLDASAATETREWRGTTGDRVASGYSAGRRHRMDVPGIASYFFTSEGHADVTAVPQASSHLVEATYRGTVVPMVLQARGMEVLHASAVLASRGVVALCAVSGTGKSTIASELDRQGWPAWADDAVAFDASPNGVTTIRLPLVVPTDASAPRRGHERQPVSRAEGGTASQPLAALCVLRRDEGLRAVSEDRILDPSDAFPNVLSHAYCFSLADRPERERMVRNYLRLCSLVPVSEIRFRPGLRHLSEVADRVRSVAQLG